LQLAAVMVQMEQQDRVVLVVALVLDRQLDK
jgi:hypothetical protein